MRFAIIEGTGLEALSAGGGCYAEDSVGPQRTEIVSGKTVESSLNECRVSSMSAYLDHSAGHASKMAQFTASYRMVQNSHAETTSARRGLKTALWVITGTREIGNVDVKIRSESSTSRLSSLIQKNPEQEIESVAILSAFERHRALPTAWPLPKYY